MWQYDVELVQEIEKVVGKKLEEHETKEDEVLKGITAVRYYPQSVFSLSMGTERNHFLYRMRGGCVHLLGW